jgi:hypothetical protein
MRRIIATSVVALLIVGCSQQAPLENLADGNCNGAVVGLVNEHISGQIDALAMKDWELALSFASNDFQANVSIDDFIFVIKAQYPMLIKNKGYEFNKCTVAGDKIQQEVKVLSDEQEFSLAYILTVTDSTLGVESAVVSSVDPKVSA